MNGMVVTKFEILKKKIPDLTNKIKLSLLRKDIVSLPLIEIEEIK